MKTILVLGGTGFVGRSTCASLRAAGHGLRVPSRSATAAASAPSTSDLHPVHADVHDPAELRRLLDGCDAAVNLVAILHGSAAAFERVHVELPRRLALACRDTGVRRLVHVSALGADAAAPSRYLRSKAAGEAVLAAAGLDLTILRPSVIFGAGDRFLNLFARLQAVLPVLPLAGARARFQPVWVEDVARAITTCIDRPETIGTTVECAGPEVLTLRELVERAGRWSGHPRTVIELPDALGRCQALAMECLPGEPLMSRDNLDSMRVPNIACGLLPGLPTLGIVPAQLERIGPGYLGGARR